MSNWPCFNFGQEDLHARSREPQLAEREYYSSNHLYGGAEVLRNYAGLPPGMPIPWALQLVLDFRTEPEMETNDARTLHIMEKMESCGMPGSFFFNELFTRAATERGLPNPQSIGHTFLYARDNYHRAFPEAAEPERRGTIALPDKSDLNKLLDFDREAYAARLAALPEEYQPVYVSMHWRDYERGCHEPYLKAGLKMVCSGHPNEPEFYFRLYDIFRQFKYACSNEISTSYGLSVLSGCRFFYLEGGDVTIVRPSGSYTGPEPLLDRPGRQACVEASPYPPSLIPETSQQELAARFCGLTHKKSPEFFQQQWSLARQALSETVTTGDFSFSQTKGTRDLAGWLCHGMDIDGWADPHSGLEVPHRTGFAEVELRVEVLRPAVDAPDSPFMMSVNDAPLMPVSWSGAGGKKSLRVPVPPSGQRTRITFLGPPPVQIGMESRRRSFRLASIHWIPESKPATDASASTTAPLDQPSWFQRKENGALVLQVCEIGNSYSPATVPAFFRTFSSTGKLVAAASALTASLRALPTTM